MAERRSPTRHKTDLSQTRRKFQREAAKSTGTVQDVQMLVSRYAVGVPWRSNAHRVNGPEHASPVVLLTGSTGNIGSHILACLLSDDRIHRVFTLNRPSADPNARLRAAFSDRCLPTQLLEHPKLSSWTGDVTQCHFGLSLPRYEEMLASITHIIHNAWTVNFNLPLSAYEDQISGVRQLIDICASTEQTVTLFCTTSIGIATQWDPSLGPVPEKPLPSPEFAINNGYSASKYVVEQILAQAAEHGIPTMSVRMGQAVGPASTGAWGTTEWVPILVRSSVALGCLPHMSGPITWVPLDAIGRAHVDWLTTRKALPRLVNFVHPRPTTWETVLAGLRAELAAPLPSVPFAEWVARLDALAARATAADYTRVPALKLLQFFRGMAARRVQIRRGVEACEDEDGLMYETAALRRSSTTMRELQPMTEEHARMWVRYWKAMGWIGQAAEVDSKAKL